MPARGIAVIGAGMIGAAHASGYRLHLPGVSGSDGSLHTICDLNPLQARTLATRYGFAHSSTDWRATIAHPEIGILSICLPNHLHAEATEAALRAGKHVLCEKPLALTAGQIEPIRKLARGTPATSGTVFNYRRIPAVADIRHRMISGALGKPVQILIQFQCDYAADPLLPHSWRYSRRQAGSGALLDVGTHAVDLARFILGDISEVVGAISTTTVRERYLPRAATAGHAKAELSDQTAAVENEDVMSAILRFASGAQGFVTASRVAIGMGNRLQIEVYGTGGTARFSNETPTHFDLALWTEGAPAAFQRIINRPSSPAVGELVAVPHDLVTVGYAECFGFMIHEFLDAIARGQAFENGSIEDGYRAAQVLDAIQQASETNLAVPIDWRN